LLSGQGDGGSVSVSSLMRAVQEGLKIKGVYLSQRSHGTSLAVLADGPIKSPADFKGKNIGTFSTTSSRNFDGQAMIAAAGLNPKSDVSWVPVGFGVQAMTALKNGSVAGLILWDNAYATIENMGTKLRYFDFPFQKNLVGYTMITTDEKLKTDRKKIIGYLRGLAKGAVFAQVNPKAASCIYMEISGKMKTSKNPAKEMADETNVIRTNSVNAEVEPDDTNIGSFPKEKMQHTQKYYFDQGILNKIISVEEYYVTDPEFYRAINDFDRQTVVAEAKNYQGCQ
jgi:NitT/TauT family transport system substrate-binding protein